MKKNKLSFSLKSLYIFSFGVVLCGLSLTSLWASSNDESNSDSDCGTRLSIYIPSMSPLDIESEFKEMRHAGEVFDVSRFVREASTLKNEGVLSEEGTHSDTVENLDVDEEGASLSESYHPIPKKMSEFHNLMKRKDGYYIYLLTRDSHLIISPRFPLWMVEEPKTRDSLNPKKKWIATHLSLFRHLKARLGQEIDVIAAGQIQMSAGVPVLLNNRSKGFRDLVIDHIHLKSKAAKELGMDISLFNFIRHYEYMDQELKTRLHLKLNQDEQEYKQERKLLNDAINRRDSISNLRLNSVHFLLTSLGWIDPRTVQVENVTSQSTTDPHFSEYQLAETWLKILDTPTAIGNYKMVYDFLNELYASQPHKTQKQIIRDLRKAIVGASDFSQETFNILQFINVAATESIVSAFNGHNKWLTSKFHKGDFDNLIKDYYRFLDESSQTPQKK